MSPHSRPYHSRSQWSLIDGIRYKIQRHILSEISKPKYSVKTYPATFHHYALWNRPFSPNFPKHRQRGHIAQRTHCCRDTNQYSREYPQHHPPPRHRLHQHIRDKFGFHELFLCCSRLLFNMKGTRNLTQCCHQQGNPCKIPSKSVRNEMYFSPSPKPILFRDSSPLITRWSVQKGYAMTMTQQDIALFVHFLSVDGECD